MVSIPVVAIDAEHMEALGPLIATLLLDLLPPGQAFFIGNSLYIMDPLTGHFAVCTSDLYSFYCVELTRDLMSNPEL